MQYLIIGAGPAGVNAAETLRKLDAEPVSISSATNPNDLIRGWRSLTC